MPVNSKVVRHNSPKINISTWAETLSESIFNIKSRSPAIAIFNFSSEIQSKIQKTWSRVPIVAQPSCFRSDLAQYYSSSWRTLLYESRRKRCPSHGSSQSETRQQNKEKHKKEKQSETKHIKTQTRGEQQKQTHNRQHKIKSHTPWPASWHKACKIQQRRDNAYNARKRHV